MPAFGAAVAIARKPTNVSKSFGTADESAFFTCYIPSVVISTTKPTASVQHQCHGVLLSLATDVHALVLHAVQPLDETGISSEVLVHTGVLS